MDKHLDKFIEELSKGRSSYYVFEEDPTINAMVEDEINEKTLTSLIATKPYLSNKQLEIHRFIGGCDQTIIKIKDDSIIVRREYRMI